MTAAPKVAGYLVLVLLLATAVAQEGDPKATCVGDGGPSESGNGGGVNCKKRPTGFRAVTDCCDIPPYDFDQYKEKCKNVMNASPRPQTACLLDCLFNVSDSLTGYTLRLPQVHIMLQTILPQHDDFSAAYYKSFEECDTLIKHKVDEFMESERGRSEKQKASNRKRKCMPFAFFYSMCAHVKMLQHCPAHAWLSTKKCADSRAYVTNCEQQILSESLGKWNFKADDKRKRGQSAT